jgi:hypothetical protein
LVQRPSIWLAGDAGNADFTPAVAWLNSVACCEVATPSEPRFQTTGFPAAIVVFQSRPGTLTQNDIEALHRRAPLARLVSIVGPWCDGELRSGRPWHGVTRIHWHEWQLRLPRELGLVAPAAATNRLEPRTLTDVDRLLCTASSPGPRRPVRGSVAICTLRRELFLALADACSIAGLESVWQQPGTSLVSHSTMRLFDGWEMHGSGASEGETSPAVLLLDWPRPDDLARAEQQGIRQVLAQPLFIADLLMTFDELLPPNSASPTANAAA